MMELKMSLTLRPFSAQISYNVTEERLAAIHGYIMEVRLRMAYTNNSFRNIFCLPFKDIYLIYSPMHDIVALVNRSAAQTISRKLREKHPDDTCEWTGIASLLEKLKSPPMNIVKRKTGGFDPDFLGIICSRRCNMRCAYCDFSSDDHSPEITSIEKILAVIDDFVVRRKRLGSSFFNIEFFGGEPFIEQEMVDIIVHHSRLIGSITGIFPRFSAITNGVLTPKQRTFIKDYFQRIIVSFDGFQKHHDKTRMISPGRSSFPGVVETLESFSGTSIEFAIRCCITSDSVEDMQDMTRWFCERFNPDIINFETLTVNGKTEKTDMFSPDPYRFASNLLKSRRIMRDYCVDSVYAPVSLDALHVSTCHVGTDAMILHPDGRIASCYLKPKDWEEKGLDFTIGKVDDANRVNIMDDKVLSLRTLVEYNERCSRCFCLFSCAGNCHVNSMRTNNDNGYTDSCKQTRIVTIGTLLEQLGALDLLEEWIEDEKSQKDFNRRTSDMLIDMEADYESI